MLYDLAVSTVYSCVLLGHVCIHIYISKEKFVAVLFAFSRKTSPFELKLQVKVFERRMEVRASRTVGFFF